MKLVFIHGWGLSPAIWDDVAARLPEFKQRRVDLGFFGPPSPPVLDDEPAVLIGHSFGFVHGLLQNNNWHGWIAINSFPCFVKTDTSTGCTSPAELRDIRTRLNANPEKTLHDFHTYIGAKSPTDNLQAAKLREALDQLRDSDVENIVRNLAVKGLVLASRNDPLVPVHVSETLAANQTLAWHEKGGHVLPQSAPDWCANAIRDFVTKL